MRTNFGAWNGAARPYKQSSHFWKGLQEVKECFWPGIRFQLGDGSRIDFWREKWIGNEQLKYSFQKLYEVSRKKEISVKLMYRRGIYRLSRAQSGDYTVHLERNLMTRRLQDKVPLQDQEDKPEWLWSKNKIFTVASCYTVTTY